MVADGNWSFIIIELQGGSSRKSSGHVYFMEKNSLQAISFSQNMYFYFVCNSSSYTLGIKERTANIQIRPCVKWSLTRSDRLREIRSERR